MAKAKAVTYFVAVSDTSKALEEQEGILLEVEGRGGDTPKNRAKALEMVNQMWEKGEITDDKFPDGITSEQILYVPPDSPQLKKTSSPQEEENNEIHPIVQGAQEIIQLTKLQIEVQDAAQDVAPYTPIIQAVLDRSRPLSSEEKDLAKDRKYGKIIERMGTAVANQEEFQSNCTGNGKLILNAIAWQLEHQEY